MANTVFLHDLYLHGTVFPGLTAVRKPGVKLYHFYLSLCKVPG